MCSWECVSLMCLLLLWLLCKYRLVGECLCGWLMIEKKVEEERMCFSFDVLVWVV